MSVFVVFDKSKVYFQFIGNAIYGSFLQKNLEFN